MDNHIFRSAIGGFNRQDVIEYIERTQKQSEESIAWLESQVGQLQKSEEEARSALMECSEERDRLAAELEEMTAKYGNARNNWESQAKAKESSRRDVAQRDQTIRDLTEENQALFRRVQEMESAMEDLRRQKEQLAQLELDAHHRAEKVVEAAQGKAKAIVKEAEDAARAVTGQAQVQAQEILEDAGGMSQMVVRETRLCIADTVADFDEVMESFEDVSERIADGLRLLERTMNEFPIGLNELKKDLDKLHGRISKKDAELQGQEESGEGDTAGEKDAQ